jgi:hypothetical protein
MARLLKVDEGSVHEQDCLERAVAEAKDELRQMLVAIPAVGRLDGANRYDTDDHLVLHVWHNDVSWDIEVPRVLLGDVPVGFPGARTIEDVSDE